MTPWSGHQRWSAGLAQLRYRVKWLYRRVRGRCVNCGGARTRFGGYAPLGSLCGTCTKRWMLGTNYGMSATRLQAHLNAMGSR